MQALFISYDNSFILCDNSFILYDDNELHICVAFMMYTYKEFLYMV